MATVPVYSVESHFALFILRAYILSAPQSVWYVTSWIIDGPYIIQQLFGEQSRTTWPTKNSICPSRSNGIIFSCFYFHAKNAREAGILFFTVSPRKLVPWPSHLGYGMCKWILHCLWSSANSTNSKCYTICKPTTLGFCSGVIHPNR